MVNRKQQGNMDYIKKAKANIQHLWNYDNFPGSSSPSGIGFGRIGLLRATNLDVSETGSSRSSRSGGYKADDDNDDDDTSIDQIDRIDEKSDWNKNKIDIRIGKMMSDRDSIEDDSAEDLDLFLYPMVPLYSRGKPN